MSLTRGLDHRDGEEVKELATCPPSPRQKVPGREQHRVNENGRPDVSFPGAFVLDQMSPGLWDPRCKLVLNIVADCQTCHSQVWVIQCSPGARSGSVMRRSPFGVDICCRKGSRSPLQELYNPTQRSLERVSPPWLELSNTAVLHQMRRDQVTDTCRANSAVSRKRRVLTPSDLKHLVVDEDHELIYCYVPKVACTNWKRLMMVLTGRGKYSDPMEIPANEAHVSANLKTLNQYSIPEINHRLKSYMKFLFVREPFERLVSAYRNKFTQKYNTSFHKRYGTKIVRRQRKNATQEALRKGDDVKFEEFVAYLIDPHTQREEPFNEHWQTVYSLCHPCHIHYDLVGKYETLEEDSNYVLQLAGVGSYLKFPTYAKSTRTTDEMTTEFFQNISSEHQTQLYEVYKLDFLMFNYSVPSYLKLE
ncbi:carbohydrate sulfotransferase 11 isoform X1 [Neophocaena asiaeorientalis asiaeorientalis]|uniref:Carbohydrate sulfotransferase n=3 Tax=Neophocaena asiaeorientalis asiaeorientalis TaxID=1706337 RepID=A0A341AE90_NEOAA|nr:carbohydrate sulfotransferase 11 isoform X1 [Neophocaena asiaeorientalis asiaeorientalis]XP_032502700.1 carbohydrate sulfotransferase 11 isoform X1 [Phocoena sinus]